MAKSKLKRKQILRRLEAERFERRLASKRFQRIRRRASSGYRPSRFEVVSSEKRRGPWIDLRVPDNLDLIANFKETVDFVADFRHTALDARRPVRLIFDQAKEIRPAALLLLTAALHQCRLMQGPVFATGTYPTDKKLERMLDQTGFFELLQIVTRVPAKSRARKVHYIRFVSDNKLAEDAARKLRLALLGEKVAMNILARKKLFRVISEAMINVGQHAYPKEQRFPTARRWWLIGTVDKGKNELLVTFCDLGVGIPQTLPKLYAWEIIRAALSLLPYIKPNDGQMIQAAMTIGRTQTGKSERGKGLNDLRSFIDLSGSGEMHIASGHGVYHYSAGGIESFQNFRAKLPGTLIKWSVPLDKVTNWSQDVSEVDDEDSN